MSVGEPPADPRLAQPRLAQLGEDGVLAVLNRRFARAPGAKDWPEGTVGPGDDAAVLAAPDGRVVLTVDAMVQDQDFRLRWPSGVADTGYSTGWKAAAQNLSDVNAMGARASSLLVTLTLPQDTPVRWLDACAAGIVGAVRHLGATNCRIAGGDLGSAPQIGISITATGDLSGRPAVQRSLSSEAAERWAEADLDLVHCGRAGWAAAGLAVLDTPRRELLALLRDAGQQTSGIAHRGQDSAAPERGQPDPGLLRLAALACAAQLRPRPSLEAGPRAAVGGILAMMDVSDGLERDAARLARATGRTVELDAAWVRRAAAPLEPLARALEGEQADRGAPSAVGDPAVSAELTVPGDATAVGKGAAVGTGAALAERWVRTGGEDYGLLGLVPAGATPPEGFTRVGVLRAGPAAGTAGSAPEHGGGWDHFGPST